jgi:hypothetical protein
MFLAVTDDQQAQQSGLFPNAQKIYIAGGSFYTTIVNLCYVSDFSTNSLDRTIFRLLILVECRYMSLSLKSQTPVQSLLDGKMYLINLGRYSLIRLLADQCREDTHASSGEWVGLERPRFVSSS